MPRTFPSCSTAAATKTRGAAAHRAASQRVGHEVEAPSSGAFPLTTKETA